MIPVARWEPCLKRDLDIEDDDDVKLFQAYYDQVMAKATGTTECWNTAHRGYFCLYNGHPPNKKQSIYYYVTPETEAHALLAINGNHDRWNAQYLTSDKYPNYKQKCINFWPSDDVIEASDKIKERLYREQNNMDHLTDMPDGWQARMRLIFEGPIPEDDKARKPNQVSACLPVFGPYYLVVCPFINAVLPIDLRQIFLSEVKKEGTTKIECWAATYGNVFKNRFTDGCSGQQNFTGLTVEGAAKYNEYLEAVKQARADPECRKFEKDFLSWFQGKSDIKCSTYEEDCKRRAKRDPKDGIATDSKEDEEWNDACLYPDEVPAASDDEE